ncbi:flagellar biosynthetic protein FliP [Candidatus Marinamargulisbacteria bacterium SCGC AG-414-C22]|nr:flagellar biosynthetic protein FliP [Candidatus Marinamargulisbacteria bacterium SCGC AG-414-C22]
MYSKNIVNVITFFVRKLSFLVIFLFLAQNIFAQASGVNIDLGSLAQTDGFSSSINLLVIMSMITLVPFFLISTTSFLRIVIVLSMLRQALATQQSPPNSVLVGLAIFMTIFVMTPTINDVMEQSITPYQNGEISQVEAMERGIKPFRNFMLKFTSEPDLALFLEFSKIQYTDNIDDVPIFVIIPSFILSELKRAFQIGFLLFIPFLVVDLIISNILLSLGMFMLSPAMVSLPFKVLLFVLTNGWNLIVQGLLLSFR